MILKNPFFLLGLGMTIVGNTWFVLAHFREIFPTKPFHAIGILPALLIPPVTAFSAFYLHKIHKGTKVPIWICIAGVVLCFSVQAYNS